MRLLSEHGDLERIEGDGRELEGSRRNRVLMDGDNRFRGPWAATSPADIILWSTASLPDNQSCPEIIHGRTLLSSPTRCHHMALDCRRVSSRRPNHTDRTSTSVFAQWILWHRPIRPNRFTSRLWLAQVLGVFRVLDAAHYSNYVLCCGRRLSLYVVDSCCYSPRQTDSGCSRSCPSSMEE